MKNSKGSIFPFTVMMVLLFFLVLLHLTSVFLLEKSFYSDTKQYYKMDNLILRGAIHSIRTLKSFPEETAYLETLEDGQIAYKIIKGAENTYKVEISCETKDRKKNQSSFIYDTKKSLITKWSEW